MVQNRISGKNAGVCIRSLNIFTYLSWISIYIIWSSLLDTVELLGCSIGIFPPTSRALYRGLAY